MKKQTPPPTERIRFRRYRASDVDAVIQMFADPQARRFYPKMGEPGAGAEWIRWSQKNYHDSGLGLWAIEHRESADFLGDCGLTYQPVGDLRLLEVGYHLHADHRGHGYATEAGRACVDFAFANLAASLVSSIVDPDNLASIGVASRLHSSRKTFENAKGRTMWMFWTGLAE